MASINIAGDTSGSISLTVPSVAGTNTVTIPASSGVVMVSGNMPAFSAYQSSSQSITAGSFTKVQFQSEEFDTANAFDSTTNYRFQPTVAGYYQITGSIAVGVSACYVLVTIYKNGSEFKRVNYSNPAQVNGMSGSALIYLNGSTDYVEFYALIQTTQILNTSSTTTYFQGALIRAA